MQICWHQEMINEYAMGEPYVGFSKKFVEATAYALDGDEIEIEYIHKSHEVETLTYAYFSLSDWEAWCVEQELLVTSDEVISLVGGEAEVDDIATERSVWEAWEDDTIEMKDVTAFLCASLRYLKLNLSQICRLTPLLRDLYLKMTMRNERIKIYPTQKVEPVKQAAHC